MSDQLPDEIRDEPDQDEPLNRLFAALDSDAAPVDREFLTALRTRSAEVYADQAVQPAPRREEKRARFYLFAPLAAAAAAIIVAAMLWPSASSAEDASFAAVLADLAEADTLELQVAREGQTEKLLVKQRAKSVRWNHADGIYDIAHSGQQWKINEQANVARSESSSFFPAGLPGFDLFAVLSLPAGADRDQFAKAFPVEQVSRAGAMCDIYRWIIPANDGANMTIEASVDAQTRRLQSLQAEREAAGRRLPLITINVVAVDRPIDDSLFVVGKTLTEDGRVGKVADVQGVVTLKPVMHRRWTSVETHALVHPGDWVRTDVRGANAAVLQLVSNVRVTLGPNTLVEVINPTQFRLVEGEVKIVAEKSSPLELLGPQQEKLTVVDTAIIRLAGEKLVRIEKPPQWLAGFEGATSNESIGSLVAKVDGRDVPLTVGDHKVTIDIRDQIARTVIEESFVNHTPGRLEGVFYFPLPQDASISGFGMWIGSELVEADVVEKQRAQEIYETILREKRDPGLLEWTGGNIFRARVFPIEPHSEKRIKISYTQVLPLRGKELRYSYGLRSELLKKHPLRELAIDVKLSSVLPLKTVHCPTHTGARIDSTGHSAHVEFSAQEYTPDRDFEIVAELADDQPKIAMVPHRRGDDGYFMLMLSPPGGAGEWQREVLPDSQPLNLLILADTSASMDAPSRQAQAELVAAVLSSLAPEDQFNLATCDVDCEWAFAKSQAANETNIHAARDRLANRESLGWTDLDRAFGSALSKAGEVESTQPADEKTTDAEKRAPTQIIYIGDGIVTTKNADPNAFAKRLRLLCEGKNVAMHAISVSSSFEPLVLKTIASLGGGSFRQISGERTPQSVAADLLREIARPTLRDLRVEFTGIETARVYPRELSNLPTGSQQILLGRYLPRGVDQKGSVIVTGMLNGESVRFSTDVTLASVPEASQADDDMSFIPRLWARMHLDELLAQGTSQSIQDEIIALSEEYHIMTPYTSLLVLESDADRERFKVRRRFQMRDAERFFAEGRDNVDYELLGQQMRRAGAWRLGLRQQVLAELMGLGRDSETLPQSYETSRRRNFNQRAFRQGSFSASGTSYALDFSGPISEMMALHDRRNVDFDSSMEMLSASVYPADDLVFPMAGEGAYSLTATTASNWDVNGRFESAGEEWFDSGALIDDESKKEAFFSEGRYAANNLKQLSLAFDGGESQFMGGRKPMGMSGIINGPVGSPFPLQSRSAGIGGGGGFGDFAKRAIRDKSLYSNFSYYFDDYASWLGTLFPALPAPPAVEKPIEPAKQWPGEARDIVAGLVRTELLAGLAGGLRIERQSESFEPRWDVLTGRSTALELVSPTKWLVRTGSIGTQTIVQSCDGDNREIYSLAFQLGRRRKTLPRELERPPIGLDGHMLTSLERTFYYFNVEVQSQSDGQKLIIFTSKPRPEYETRYAIDPARKVVLSIENRENGEVTSTVRYDEFVEVAGAWWPGRAQAFDKQGRRTSVTTTKYTALESDAFLREVAAALAGRDRVQFITDPLLGHAAARRALDAGKADFSDRIALMLRFCANQQWDKVFEHLDAAEKLAAGKPGMRWIRGAILGISRRGEELKGHIQAAAHELVQANADAAAGNEDLFLANYFVGQAGGVLAANEMLALLDVLKPVYERQPAYVAAMKGWTQNRANQLRSAGRPDEALALQKQLAADYSHDVSLQIEYASALFNIGEYEAAYAWLDKVTNDAALWLPPEDQRLRETFVGFLESQGRWSNAADYLARWVERNPETTAAYERYLGTLLRLDRLDEMHALVTKWLQEGRQQGKISPAALSRLNAAISQALGEGYAVRTNRLDERWLDPLADTVRFFARHASQAGIAERIMGNDKFRDSDQCRQLRREYLAVLTAEIATLKADEINRLMNWVMANDPAVENSTWKPIADTLEERWARETDSEERHQLSQSLVRILSGRFPEEHLAFLRRQLAEGPEKYRSSFANQLFNALLAQPWSLEIESESLALVEKLPDSAESCGGLGTKVRAVYRLTDHMVQARYTSLMAKVENQEKLTRTELRDKQAESMRLAREGYADRLRLAYQEGAAALRPWFNIERLYLEMQLGRDLDHVAAECWEFLGPKPPAEPAAIAQNVAADTAAADAVVEWQLDQVLRSRHLATAANLAARRNAKPEFVDRLLAYIDAAIAQAEPDDVAWRYFKYQMLVALDRPKDLEESLRGWLRVDDPLNFWRVSLAYVLAEQGKLVEAIPLLEAVEADGELGPGEYRALADWYLVQGQREEHEAALLSTFDTAEEWQLQNWLWQQLRPWQYAGHSQAANDRPTELDKNVLRVFDVLFKKSGSPQNYASQLREFYRATRDFRLLAGVAQSMTGHTAERVYPFLLSLEQVFGEVREEATVDSMVDEIKKVRGAAKTTLDERALDLLEVIVERRASALQNQPGPHSAAALATLRRAFDREWQPGEQRHMADFLANLGTVRDDEFAVEQRRELQVLHDAATAGSFDRLYIGHARARCLWGYSRQDEAIDLLEAALNEFRTAHEGILPTDANGPLDTYLSYLESRSRHARGEQVLFDELKHPANAQQKLWLRLRLYRLYRSALAMDGSVALGTGPDLFRAVQVQLQAELDTPDHNHRKDLVAEMCSIYTTAHDKKLPDYQKDLRAFAFERLPAVLDVQTNNYQQVVMNVAETLRQLIGPRDGLEFLVTCIEREPKWFRYSNENGWQRFGWQLAEWRRETQEAGRLDGALSERLVAIVLAALRTDLETRAYSNRSMYHRGHGGSQQYWSEKQSDFRRTAEEVYERQKSSGAAVKYIADYLYQGLHQFRRAIEILFVANGESRLDEDGQATLVRYLQEQQRYGESIAVLEPLVKLRPENIEYRTRLMHAYFHTQRKAELSALLAETDRYFHENRRWGEGPLAALAHSCLENELFEQSAAYYEELIKLHQQTQPNRGIGNGTLSNYYGHMARAYAGLKNTSKAVDAASGAIVAWGPTRSNRRSAIDALIDVLRRAPDLDDFVKELDRRVAESGLENPIVRKSLGTVYAEKNQYAQAIEQLELARDSQPNDAETHKLLVECYDKQNDRAGAARQLLASIELSRRDIELYRDLGRRYRDMDLPDQAERAVTSIVEMRATESESHAMLAEIRQEQSRWGEAIDEWRRVSELRALEPTGLLKLAAAQIHERQWGAASETVRRLQSREWPSRFINVDNEIRELERTIEQSRGR